ncbi:MAG: 8-amino-7-oxononanoate synthase [Balneolaceae bacterium]|nr:8-amino-7-oxononanoate synthase [Balneolaceae bacterium]MBO6547492.1 8-amino-7-oxononanoate synthase [Balneolaceae bacterium]MBO6647561.1 8-amino-7-oxononanoate synthase [Balneolaceae bacterium]
MSNKNPKTDFIKTALGQRHHEYRFRSLTPVKPILGTSRVIRDGKEVINFCSNDYLGLSSHPKVIERSKEFAENYGAGSGSSRLVSGTLDIHQSLEEKLADTFGLEAVLVFNSGFQANASILSSLADRSSLILADKKCHNSLIQGALLSRADFKRFNHNDLNNLEVLLKTASNKDYNRIWVVSETVFSMDGDLNDIEGLIKLSEKYGALLYSDDAHALGVLGEKGLGLNYRKEGIDLSLGTFGKAFGSFGAFAGCSSETKDYLINFCPGFIYTTALPPAIIGALDAALELIPEMESERETLHSNIQYLIRGLKGLGFKTGDTESQIIPVIIGSEEEAMNLSNYLEENGIWASAIRPPTVEKDASRIRITITLNHKKEELDQLLKALIAWKER